MDNLRVNKKEQTAVSYEPVFHGPFDGGDLDFNDVKSDPVIGLGGRDAKLNVILVDRKTRHHVDQL